jgi:hypothetical protein
MSDPVRQKCPPMIRTPKIGFLSTLVLSLALAGFGCDSSKKNEAVIDAASDHVSADGQVGPDSTKPLDGGSTSTEAGNAETAGDDARLTNEDGSAVIKDAPAPGPDAPSDLAVSDSSAAVSDSSAD